MPLAPATVTEPVLLPKHATLVCEVMLLVNAAAGWVIVTDCVFKQPFASFTVIV